MRLFILLIVFSFMGCGKDDSKGASSNELSQGNTGLENPGSGTVGERGPQGQTGAQGAKGEKGDPGERGTNGAKGDQGTAGKDAEPLPVNQWYDPLTQDYWLITTEGPWQAEACGEWRFPTAQEMLAAINHGIYLASHAIDGPETTAWSGDVASPGHVSLTTSIVGASYDYEIHGIFCIRPR